MKRRRPKVAQGRIEVVGGYAALAEGAWMGAAQGVEVGDLARVALAPLRAAAGRARGFSLRGVLTREYSVTEASLILMASFFFSAVLGAGRQILFNAKFGAGLEANAYYAAFRLPDTLFSLIAGGALSAAMIPILLSTVHEDGDESAARLINLVLTTLLAVFTLAVVLGELFAPAFVGTVLAPGFSPAAQSLTVTLTRIMLLQPVILALGSVAIAVLNSRNQFLLTAASIASHNIGLIAGIVATSLHPALGIYGPTYGVVAGSVLQVLILLPGVLADRIAYRPAWNLRDPRLRQVIALLIPNGLAIGVLYAGFIMDTSFASRAPQSAGLAALHNAWLLVGLPIALFGQAIGQSIFPRLADMAAREDWASMRRTMLRSVGVVIVLALVAAVGLIVLGRPAIRVLFQHGSYGASAALLTYRVLIPYSIALPAYVVSEIVTRTLVALRDTRTPLLTNTGQVVGRACLMALLIGSLGVRAVPVAFAAMGAAEAIVLAGIAYGKVQRRLQLAPVPQPVAVS
jgi:putative peptidoglycan lipid II flippase